MAKAKEHAIYVLIDKSDNSFFVWYCDMKNVYLAFKHHYQLRFLKTQRWIENMKSKNTKPCIFVLETINGTREECYGLTLIWTKIFIENNYKSIESENVLSDVEYIYEDKLENYFLRKQTNLNEMIGCENCILPYFKDIYCKNYIGNDLEKLKPESAKSKKINLTFSKEEYEIVVSKSKELKVPIAQYAKELVLNGEINYIDFKNINEYKKVMGEINKNLNAYFITAVSTQQIFTNELESYQNLMNEIVVNQKKILTLLNQEIKLLIKSKRRFE